MNKLISFSAVYILLLLAMCLNCFALFLPISDEDLILTSHDVIHGIVKEIRCETEGSKYRIVSYITIEVLEVFKGELRDEVVIFQEGGTVGGLSLDVSDNPEYEEGMEVIIHTYLMDDGRLTTRYGDRGVYGIKDGIVNHMDMTLDQFKDFVGEVIKQHEEEKASITDQ